MCAQAVSFMLVAGSPLKPHTEGVGDTPKLALRPAALSAAGAASHYRWHDRKVCHHLQPFSTCATYGVHHKMWMMMQHDASCPLCTA